MKKRSKTHSARLLEKANAETLQRIIKLMKELTIKKEGEDSLSAHGDDAIMWMALKTFLDILEKLNKGNKRLFIIDQQVFDASEAGVEEIDVA